MPSLQLSHHRPVGSEPVTYRLPVTHTATPGLGAAEDDGRFAYDLAGFEVAVDITTAADGEPLPDGLWDISLAIGAQGLSKEVRIGSKRAEDVSRKTSAQVVATGEELRAVALYTTKPYGNFTLDLGECKHEVLPHLGIDGIRWAADALTELEVTGRCTLASYPEGALMVGLTDSESGGVGSFPARQVSGAGGDFVVRVPVATLPAGVWGGELRLGPWVLPLPELPRDLAPAKWRRQGLPWYAKPVPDGGGRFALEVARTKLVKAMARRLR
ncbi:hypothetical protein ABZX30_01295 [Streptomyces sp. NPDC004542]|uniref:hypothetical protein n=1 Tax=Streptomyces sp. NPDC004542 TaxID=3154281 RepID=UPI0033A8E85B